MRESREAYAADLAFQYDLSLPQGRQLAELALHALDPTFAPDSPRLLADPAVAVAYAFSPLGPHAADDSIERTDEVARCAIDGGMATAGAWYLRACVAEDRGDLDAMRAHLDASLSLDPGFGPTHAAVGFLAFVAGDVAAATRALRASDDANAPRMLHSLSHVRARPSSIGRNQRCPCGSGAKHKHCCANRAGSLTERSIWLWEKAAFWLRRLPQTRHLFRVACDLADADDIFDEDAVSPALGHPLLEPVALLEAGLLGRFVDRLGDLLPADERALAEDWMPVRHSVWRVDATTPGTSLRLADLVTGEVVEATNGAVSRCTRPGEVVFGAVLPTPEGGHLPGHPTCLDPDDADELVDLIRDGEEPFEVAATAYEWSQVSSV